MKDSKIVISPFGWGEFSYRDYEAFVLGAMLMKPDMSHINTWPNLYQEDKTYIPYNWNFENLIEKLDFFLSNSELRISIAEIGQETFKKYVTGNSSPELFCNQFKKTVEKINVS